MQKLKTRFFHLNRVHTELTLSSEVFFIDFLFMAMPFANYFSYITCRRSKTSYMKLILNLAFDSFSNVPRNIYDRVQFQ